MLRLNNNTVILILIAMLLQACIAFALHRGMAVIPKTVTPSRIVENMKATEVKLDAEDMKRLRELGSKNFRLLAATVSNTFGISD